MEKDFVFKFKLENNEKISKNNSEELIVFIKENIIDILNLVELKNNGQIVKVNEFSFLNDSSKTYKLY